MAAVNAFKLAETVGAVVVPVATKPVAPEPAVPDVRTSYSYPAGDPVAGGVQLIVAVVVVIAELVTAVGALQLNVVKEPALVHVEKSPPPQLERK